MIDLSEKRKDRFALEEILREAGAVIKGKTIRCPYHDDHSASGWINEGQDGSWRYTCHTPSCAVHGDYWDLKARLEGTDLKSMLQAEKKEAQPVYQSTTKTPPPTKPAETPPTAAARTEPVDIYPTLDALKAKIYEPESVFVYTNPATNDPDLVVFRVRRDGKKQFYQASPTEGGWKFGAPPRPWPLYNRSRIAAAETVLIVEGEKCVHAAQNCGITATTSPCGAGKAKYADWSPLAGKTCILWPDNDENGLAHMAEVKSILETLYPRPSVGVIDVDNLQMPKKGDVANWVAEFDPDTPGGEIRNEILEIMEAAAPETAADLVYAQFADIFSGRRSTISWPWPVLCTLTRALYPGTITLLCGDPGSSKSFFVLQAAQHWFDQGLKVAVLELEEDRTYHLRRSLAQKADQAYIVDDVWCKENQPMVENIYGEHKEWLGKFGACIEDMQRPSITLDDVAEWIEQRAKDGVQLICVDPITAADSDQNVWNADRRFMMRVKDAIRKHGCRLLLVTHPKKGSKAEIGLDGLAGGASYQRFSQTVFWMEGLGQEQEHHLHDGTTVQMNRVFHLSKCRNGRGTGLKLACQFHPNGLTFSFGGIKSKKTTPTQKGQAE